MEDEGTGGIDSCGDLESWLPTRGAVRENTLHLPEPQFPHYG